MKLRPTIQEYVDAKRAAGVRESTLRNYLRHVGWFADHLQAHEVNELEAVTAAHIRRYIGTLMTNGHKGLSVKSVQAIIVGFLRWCEREEYPVDRSVFRKLEKIRADRDEPRVLTAEEAARMLSAVENAPYREYQTAVRNPAIIRLMLDCGLRRSEVTTLRLADLDLANRWLTVRCAKNRNTAKVRLGAQVTEVLSEYLNRRGREQRPDGTVVEIPGAANQAALFLDREGTPISRSLVEQIVRRVAADAGLQGVHPHTLRHSACTLMLKNRMPVELVQRQMRHSRLEMTMRYAHLTGEDVAEAFDLASPVDRVLAKAAG